METEIFSRVHGLNHNFNPLILNNSSRNCWLDLQFVNNLGIENDFSNKHFSLQFLLKDIIKIVILVLAAAST